MTRLIGIELLKIRTTRAPFALLAAATAITALISALDAARAGGKFTPPLSASAGLSFILTITGFALLMALVFGVTLSSGEFRHDTATATYLGTPRRTRVLTAKVIASFGSGLIFGAAGAASATAVGLIFTVSKGDDVTVGAGTMTRFGLGAMLGAGLLAALGAGIGTLVRSQLADVVGALVWCLLLESILGGVFSPLGPFLPFTAATSLGGSRPGGGDIGFYGSSTGHPLPFASAAFLVIAIVGIIAVAAARTTNQADIT
jgi:ABC-2 type transport system permease protein